MTLSNQTSDMLKQSEQMQARFDPSTVQNELIKILNERSGRFKLGSFAFRYEHMEPIFFRDGPYATKHNSSTCYSCKYEFKNDSEKVYCSFCGGSNDEKCVRKTRIYPQGPEDDDGQRTLRGPICKLCDRKFMVRKEMEQVYDEISETKVELGS